MHRICVAIWETGEWPEEWTFIPLPRAYSKEFFGVHNFKSSCMM